MLFVSLPSRKWWQATWLRPLPSFDETIGLFPSFPKALANFGALLQYRGHVGEAMQVYESYLDLEPEDLEIRCNLAKTLVDLGESERAVQEAEDTCRHSQDHPRGLGNLGSVLIDLGDFETRRRGARTCLRRQKK